MAFGEILQELFIALTNGLKSTEIGELYLIKYYTYRWLTDCKDDDSVCRYSPLNLGSSGFGKLLVGWRHLHGLGVDEGEEEDVGAVLLILVQPRLPNGVRFKALVVVVSKENIDAHDLKDFAWYYRL